MQRICKYCGAEYSGDPGSSACPACVTKIRSTTIRDCICRACGTTFQGGPRAWYCPICRAERRREADRRHKRTGTSRKLGSTDLCQICGQPYTVTGSLQKYCPSCAPEAVRAIDRQQSAAWQQANATPEQRRAERQAYTAPTICAVCGKPFVPDTVAHTCSPECQAAYAKIRAANWEREHRQQRTEYQRNLRAKKR